MPSISRLVFIAATLYSALSVSFTTVAADLQNAAATQKRTLTHDGIERSYVIRVPTELSRDTRRVPLVLVLHGGGGNADNAEKMTGFTAKANQEGFIVVYPEGTGHRKDIFLTWNAGHCCAYAMSSQVDDVGFISALIDKLVETYPIDPKRVYVTGMSNGAMMTHRLGIALSSKIAAIAPVVGTLFGDEKKPEQPVSAIMLNGLLDKSVPYQGGAPGGRFASTWDGTATRPALDQATFWAGMSGCAAESAKDSQDTFTRWRYRCPAGQAVELYLVNDNGHAWPGGQQGSRLGDKPSSTLNATDVIWTFFKAHSK